ncbi:hypothetical protein LIA77_11075 [Sarocladium implicatum]|nr:hypothetical protein LIA77_11075 [Sarocladium implicatum]
MQGWRPNSSSLAERQRYILEKGKKRSSITRETSSDYDSANGEDPLASGALTLLQRQRQQTPDQARGPSKLSRTPVRPSPKQKQQSIAVVLSPTTRKLREDFVVVAEDEEDDQDGKAVRRRAVRDTAKPHESVSEDQPPAEPEIKRRGRPKGWKPGMAYTDIRPRATTARSAAAAATAGGPKRRGRPPRAQSPPPRVLYRRRKAGLFAFLCEWKGCSAELHNLATLRRHVHLVHAEGAAGQCRWGPCSDTPPTAASKLEGRSLRKHIEEQHLVPLAWHVGDGPRHVGDGVRRDDERKEVEEGERVVPRWLLDREGRQVTEGIWEQEVEDLATWKENRRKLKELIMRRDANLPSGEESEGEEDGKKT